MFPNLKIRDQWRNFESLIFAGYYLQVKIAISICYFWNIKPNTILKNIWNFIQSFRFHRLQLWSPAFCGTWEAHRGKTTLQASPFALHLSGNFLLLAAVSQYLKGKMLPLNDNDVNMRLTWLLKLNSKNKFSLCRDIQFDGTAY